MQHINHECNQLHARVYNWAITSQLPYYMYMHSCVYYSNSHYMLLLFVCQVVHAQ